MNFYLPVINNYESYLNDVIHDRAIDFQDYNADLENTKLSYQDAWSLYNESEQFRSELLDTYLEEAQEEIEYQTEKQLPKPLTK